MSIARLVTAGFMIGSAIAGAQAAPGSDAARDNLSASAIMDDATGFALQGDAASAAKVLGAAPPTMFQGKDADFRTCMLNRFGPTAQPTFDANAGDPWINSLAKHYVGYWQSALTKPEQRETAEGDLRSGVGELLGHAVKTEDEMDAAEDEIKREALKRGFHVLLGRTSPLLELMLWKKLTVEERKVKLPEGTQFVTVNFLDDFILRGWGYYATCSERSAGGWATEDGLFAVVPAYKSLEDETFSVRFLDHESQHFADKRAFQNLESWELEYRAKLTELALADSSQGSTLQLICENRSESKDSPHGYADSRVVGEMTKRLGIAEDDLCQRRTVTGQSLREAARSVLLEDSKKRVRRQVPAPR